MTNRITFDLVSPERLLYSDQCEMVVAPGAEGDFGVLSGHSPFMTTLRMGEITIYEGGKPKDVMFVSGGFAEATSEHFTILANRAIAKADANAEALKAERETLAAKKADDEKAGHAASVAQAEQQIVFIDMVAAKIAA